MYFVIHNDHFLRSVLAVYRGGETYTRGAQPFMENGCDVKTRKVNQPSNMKFVRYIFLLSCLKVCGCLHEERHRAGTTLFKSIGEQTKRKYEDRFLLPGDQNPDHRQGSLSTRPLSRGRLPYTGLTTRSTTSSTVDNNIDHLRHIS